MSPDLSRALHDAVDTGPDDAPFDVSSLTGRIRRRRTVRAGVRSGVAVGAAGAVALGATWIGRPAPSVLPAARADAAPGACGSDVSSLPAAGDPAVVGLAPVKGGSWSGGPDVPAAGTELGELVGRTLTPSLVRTLSVAARDAAVADMSSRAQEVLADAEQRRAEAEPGRASGLVDESRIQELNEAVRQARVEAGQASQGLAVFGIGDDLRTEVLITSGTTVVATDTEPAMATPGDYWFTSPVASGLASAMLDVDLSTCASPGDPGGVPLPSGDYSVYLTYTETGERVVEGPWLLTLLAPPPAATGLPAGFPLDDVPLIGGRLVSATPMGTSDEDGWGVEIAVDGDDAAAVAERLLGPSLDMTPDGYFRAGAWEVRIAPSETPDGERTVVYTVRPS
ncbi:hypothetical protein [Cellulomonas sp.]|uniref:hypothetical protein n=1 Tax=Cellulomonas sp. TaxID=40001 RepID=UPI003BACC658